MIIGQKTSVFKIYFIQIMDHTVFIQCFHMGTEDEFPDEWDEYIQRSETQPQMEK